MVDRRLRLPDHRTLSYSLAGDDRGYPVFFLHGIPGSRHQANAPVHGLAGLRIISPERPGYGGSSPCADYQLADHAAEISALADHLELERFSLFGFSGGGVFAMACAIALGARVERVVLAGTPAVPLLSDPLEAAGDLTRDVWRQALEAPEALPDLLMPLTDSAQTLADALMQGSREPDRTLLGSPGIAPWLGLCTAATLQQGSATAAHAMARDIALMVRPWDLDPGEVRQPVQVFHGEADALAYPAHAQALAKALPHAHLTLAPAQGHYGPLYDAATAELWHWLLLSQAAHL